MLFEVFLHTLQELRRPLLIWGAGLLVYGLLVSLLYPLAAKYPLPGVVSGFGILLGIHNPTESGGAWINLSGFALIYPLALCTLTVWVGSRLIAADEQNGALELLLSYPLPRWRLVMEKYTALAAGVFIISTALWALFALVNAAFGWNIPIQNLAGACLGLALLSLVYGTLAFSIASYTGRAGYARLVVWGVFLISYLLGAVWLHGVELLRWLSPFYYAAALPPYGAGIPLLHVLLLLAAIGVGINAAARGFEQRDLIV
jgi:ABC-2 type transport system permease protein